MRGRRSYDLGRSHFGPPLGSRFEEMDSIVFFKDVLVPWERVFLLGDVDLCNNMSMSTNQYLHSGHQVVTKNVVKCEFILGLANLMIQTLGTDQNSQVQQMMAEIIENMEVTKACLRAAEADAQIDQWGVMSPALAPISVARNLFIRMYPRMVEILHLLGSSSLMALPTDADLRGPLAVEVQLYLETDPATREERALRFRRSGLTRLIDWCELDLDERAALLAAHVELQAEAASLAGWAAQSPLQAAPAAMPWDGGEMVLDVAFAELRQRLTAEVA